MLIIIHGPQGSGKSTLAQSLVSCAVRGVWYSFMPTEKPANFPTEGTALVVIATHLPSTDWPKWINLEHLHLWDLDAKGIYATEQKAIKWDGLRLRLDRLLSDEDSDLIAIGDAVVDFYENEGV